MANPSFPKTAPPLHTVALVATIILSCLSSIPKILSSIDSVATIESCTTPLFPDLISRAGLGWIRLTFGVFIFAVTLFQITTQEYVFVFVDPFMPFIYDSWFDS